MFNKYNLTKINIMYTRFYYPDTQVLDGKHIKITAVANYCGFFNCGRKSKENAVPNEALGIMAIINHIKY